MDASKAKPGANLIAHQALVFLYFITNDKLKKRGLVSLLDQNIQYKFNYIIFLISYT